MLRVLVCGGRDYTDYVTLCRVLNRIHHRNGIATIIHGAARGADTLGGQWAHSRGIPVEEYPADWNTHGLRAGPVRNGRMLRESHPDLVVAFPDDTPRHRAGRSGTAHMVRIAREAGVPVYEKKPTSAGISSLRSTSGAGK